MTTMSLNTTSTPEAWAKLAAADTRAQQAGEPEWALARRRHAAANARSLGFPSRERTSPGRSA